jgi:hypothetical protein
MYVLTLKKLKQNKKNSTVNILQLTFFKLSYKFHLLKVYIRVIKKSGKG